MQLILAAVFSNPPILFSRYSFIDDNIGQTVIKKYSSLESAIVEDVRTVVPLAVSFLLFLNF